MEGHEREVAPYSEAILGAIDDIIGCLEGLDESQLNWRPPVPESNSLYVLAVHTMGNAEENILWIIPGEPSKRNRDQEFMAAGATAQAIHERWQALQQQLREGLAKITPADLERESTHPRRGVMSGREILLLVARHAAEHRGEADLTRKLLLATGTA